MDDSPHKCPTCGRSFNQRSNLKTHLLTHTDIKPYNCSDCGKEFRRNCDLRRHMLTHSIDLGSPGSNHSERNNRSEIGSQNPTRGRPPLNSVRHHNHQSSNHQQNHNQPMGKIDKPGQVNQVTSTAIEDGNNNNNKNGGNHPHKLQFDSYGKRTKTEVNIDLVVDDNDVADGSMDIEEEEEEEEEEDDLDRTNTPINEESDDHENDIEEIDDDDDEELEEVEDVNGDEEELTVSDQSDPIKVLKSTKMTNGSNGLLRTTTNDDEEDIDVEN